VEIIVLMLGAITLGVTIHFFITSRKSLREATDEMSGKPNQELREWKLKYFNDTELKDKELTILKTQLAEIEANNDINTIEAEETKKLNKKLKQELEELRQKQQLVAVPPGKLEDTGLKDKEIAALRKQLTELAATNEINAIETEETKKLNKQLKQELEQLSKAAPVIQQVVPQPKADYTEQLRLAQSSLMEHSQKINELLGQIDIVKETEEKQKEILKNNEELSVEIDDLRLKLSQKEKEVSNIRQKENLTKEMTSMLDNAYTEFNVLQEKILKLEQQVTLSKRANIEYEDLKEGYHKLNTDFDELKRRHQAAVTDNRELKEMLIISEDELKEANHHRQQLQKKVAYLEELNNDMQTVAETHKKLEGQLKRIGELESMLNIITEEKEQLMHKRAEQQLKAG
jgi:hypothetical protein